MDWWENLQEIMFFPMKYEGVLQIFPYQSIHKRWERSNPDNAWLGETCSCRIQRRAHLGLAGFQLVKLWLQQPKKKDREVNSTPKT